MRVGSNVNILFLSHPITLCTAISNLMLLLLPMLYTKKSSEGNRLRMSAPQTNLGPSLKASYRLRLPNLSSRMQVASGSNKSKYSLVFFLFITFSFFFVLRILASLRLSYVWSSQSRVA